jgi:serine/threonine protein kinase
VFSIIFIYFTIFLSSFFILVFFVRSELFSFINLPPSPYILPFLGICHDFLGLSYHAFCLVTKYQTQTLKDILIRLPLKTHEPDISNCTCYECHTPYIIIKIILEMAMGLLHLHEHGIVHRDVNDITIQYICN